MLALSEIEMGFSQIRLRWSIYCDLFNDENTVSLLNRSGSSVFALLQRLLVNDTIQALCRITDPEESCNKENNSLRNHFEKVRSTLEAREIAEIEGLLAELDAKMADLKTIRNKVLSHSDLALAKKSATYPDVKYDDIEKSIYIVSCVLNSLFSSIGNYMPVSTGNVFILLETLKRGQGNG